MTTRHYRGTSVALSLLAAVCFWGVQGSVAAAAEPRLIYEVDGLQVIEVGDAHYIKAVGRAASLGWTAIHLAPRDAARPVLDGVLDLMFLGTPPEGPAAFMIDEIGATYRLPSAADVPLVVRVQAAGNLRELSLDAGLARQEAGHRSWCQGSACMKPPMPTETAIRDRVSAFMKSRIGGTVRDAVCFPPCEPGMECMTACSGKICGVACFPKGPDGAWPTDPDSDAAIPGSVCMEICLTACSGLGGGLYVTCTMACKVTCGE